MSQLPPDPQNPDEDAGRTPDSVYPTKGQLEMAFRAVRKASVPQIPDIVLALREELTRPDPNLQKVTSLISQDLAISGQLLKMVNSPLFAGPGQISSVKQAITFLGITRISNMVTADAVDRTLKRTDGSARVVWESIVERARVAMVLSQLTPQIDPEEAYLFGLMHDVGSLIYADLLPEYAYAWVLRSSTPQSLLEHEREAIGVDHTIVGFLLAGTWKLPQHLALAIYHHHARQAPVTDERVHALVSIAKLCYHLQAMVHNAHETPEMLAYQEEGRQELSVPDETWETLCTAATEGSLGQLSL